MNAQKYRDKLAAQAQVRRARIAAMRDKGASLEEIAKKYNVTRQKIWALLKRYHEYEAKNNSSIDALVDFK